MHSQNDLVAILRSIGEKFPEKTAVTFLSDGKRYGGHITFSALHNRAMAIAAELQTRLPEQSEVLLLFPPGIEFIEAFFGCLYGGMKGIIVSYGRRSSSQATPTAFFKNGQPALGMIATELTGDPFLKIPTICPSRIPSTTAEVWQMPKTGLEGEIFRFIDESGNETVAESITHRDLLEHWRQLEEKFHFAFDDIVVSGLSHNHVSDLVDGILLSLVNGNSCYLLPHDFLVEDPLPWLSAISRYRGTVGITSASILELCKNQIGNFSKSSYDLSCCRSLIISNDQDELSGNFPEILFSVGFNQNITLLEHALALKTVPDAAPVEAGASKKDFLSLTATQKETLLKDKLQGIISKALTVTMDKIQSDTPLLDYGLTSIQAVALANAIWKLTGVDLSLQTFFDNMTMELLIKNIMDRSVQVWPGPTLRTAIIAEPERRFEPFELNDVQKSYLIGRQEELPLGNIGCHYYAEFETNNLDLERFIKAWERLIERHETLRTVFRDGQQQVLQEPDKFDPDLNDLRKISKKKADENLANLRKQLSHQVFNPAKWPLFNVTVSMLPGGRTIIHLNIDLLIVDWYSIFLLSTELEQLYCDPNVKLSPLEHSFRDVAQAEIKKVNKTSSVYWKKRLPELPGHPELPLAKEPTLIKKPQFERKTYLLPRTLWENIKVQAKRIHITSSAAILAAFGEILARWSQKKAFTLTMTMFGRSLPEEDTGIVLGDFTSVAYVALDKSTSETFAAGCVQIHREMMNALEHKEESAIRAIRELGGSLENNLFPIVFTSALGLSTGERKPFSWIGREIFGITQTPQVWVDHQTLETVEGLHIIWDYVRELFPESMIDDMFTAYIELLQKLARPDCSWEEPAAVNLPQSQLAVRALANDTTGELHHQLLHQLFMKQAKLQPDTPAVICTSGTTSYSSLDKMSSAIAGRLQGFDVKSNTLVAVALRKGWLQIAAVLGVLKAGAAYLPLDPDQPFDRRKTILEQAQAQMVLVDSELQNAIPWPERITQIAVDTVSPEESESIRLEPVQSLDDLAYVIFTSGSTGTPKGVMISHRGAVNTILDLNQRFGMSANDRVLSLSALNFDLSVYDIFGMLACGGTIVMPDPKLRREPAHWHELIQNTKVTLWNSVPALIEMYTEFCLGREIKLPDSLRLIWMSGDWIPVTLPDRIRLLKAEISLFSLGGATETSIWSIIYPITEINPEWKSIPYGKPLKNQTFFVFDHLLRDCPEWVPGRLYTGGTGVAKGYWNNPERTAERFVIHPESGERLYWTGDLGRYLPDGNIEFLGREDFQVKIRGYRIELEEIEAVLLQHSSVKSVAVTVHRTQGGIQRLAAYVVGRNELPPDQSELQALVSSKLPDYMIPTFWVFLPSLPLSANGKVDRKALPDPLLFREHAAPKIEDTEDIVLSQVVEISRSLLRNASVTGESNFFELGGDSLLATALTATIEKRLGVRIRLNTLFEQPILSQLAQIVRDLLDKQPETTVSKLASKELKSEAAGRYEPFPLTDVQYAYWVGRSKSFELGNAACQGYMEYEAKGLNPERFETAWRKAIARHDMLRAKIRPDGTQVVEKECPLFRIPILDLTSLSYEAQEEKLQAIREERSHLMLPTNQAPLFSVALTRLGEELWRVHINIDLLVMDFWSYLLLEEELREYYQDPFCQKEPLSFTFRNYIIRRAQNRESEDYQKAWDYWQKRCHTLPPAPKFPLSKAAAEVKRPRTVRYITDIQPGYWKSICKRAKTYGITPTTAVLTAFADVINHWSDSHKFTLNLTLFNREGDHPELNELIGDFTTINLLAFDYETSHHSFYQRARRNQKQLWEDLDHKAVGGVRVLREISKLTGVSSFRSIMPVVFTSTLNSATPLRKPVFSWLGRSTYTACQTPQVYFDHQVTEDTEGLHCSWDVVEELFPMGMIGRMRADFEAHLLRLACDEDAWQETTVPKIKVSTTGREVAMNGLVEELLRETLKKHPAVQDVTVLTSEEDSNEAILKAWVKFTEEAAALLENEVPAPMVLDPLERLAFKLEKRCIREADFQASIPLEEGKIDAKEPERWIARRSYRKFANQPLSLETLGRLLGKLRQRKFGGYPLTKQLYSSAGGLYPVQVYVYAKPDQIQGLTSGIYYYNPLRHSLNLCSGSGDCTIPGSIFEGTNVSIYNNAAFAIFLIADLDAIRPIYQGFSRDFCLIEAGIVSHLLESESVTEGIGLCQIGALPFKRIASLFKLKTSHLYLHCLLGGPIHEADTKLDALNQESSSLITMMDLLKQAGQANLNPARSGGSTNRKMDEKEMVAEIAKWLAAVNPTLAAVSTLETWQSGIENALPQPMKNSVRELSAVSAKKRTAEKMVKLLHSIFAELLDTSRVDLNTNFFDLGGNSLLAVQAVNLIRQRLGVELSVIQIFEYPTLGALAELVRQMADSIDQPLQRAGNDDLGETGRGKLKERMQQIKMGDVR